MGRDLMAAKDTFSDALEDALEGWDGQGAPEDVLEKALMASTDAEHGRRLLRHRKRLRGEKDEPVAEEPVEEPRPEDEDDLPPLEA